METTLPDTGFSDKLARRLLFKIFSQLAYGRLTIKEQGTVVAVFEGSQSDHESLNRLEAEINIESASVYRKLLVQGDIGAGESYTEGQWTSSDLTSVIRFFAANMAVLDAIQKRFAWISWPAQRLSFIFRANSKRKAKQNIAAHYDIGNELYTRFLDPNMQYSSAVYGQRSRTLEQAQENKLQLICEKLQLKPEDHLLEIGTGWGGLAIYAAKYFGCTVTTTTISEEQYAYAVEWAQREGVAERITFLKQDYRDLKGQYDKVVSIEMIEAVGARYMPVFFRQCNDLLKPGGLMVLQAITIADQRLKDYNNHVDFIQSYIFPGGYLPSLNLISTMFCRKTSMIMRDIDDIGLDYAQTLKDWRTRFNDKFPELEQQGYDSRFQRLWNYYLSYCEGGFLEKRISAVQLVTEKASHS